jgi:hypothetical protein
MNQQAYLECLLSAPFLGISCGKRGYTMGLPTVRLHHRQREVQGQKACLREDESGRDRSSSKAQRDRLFISGVIWETLTLLIRVRSVALVHPSLRRQHVWVRPSRDLRLAPIRLIDDLLLVDCIL